MSELICPNCGSKVKLPEHSSVCVGMTLSKEGNNKYYLNMEEKKESKTMNAMERLEALKANGVDTTNYFALNDSTLVKIDNGVPKIITDEDFVKNIAKKIENDGDIFNPVLDGRWIMAQMFRMLEFDGSRTYMKDKFNDNLNRKGYMYQWNMLVSFKNGHYTGELVRLADREKTGNRLAEKELWFNRTLVYNMLDDYKKKLYDYIDQLSEKHCHRIPYVSLGNRYNYLTGHKNGNIFKTDTYRKLFAPINSCKYELKRTRNYREFYLVLYRFIKTKMIELPRNTVMSAAFKEAYKGNGAYYTLNNLIRFHHCTFDGMDRVQSLNELRHMAETRKGFELLGFLKEYIFEHHIEFEM